MYQPNKIRCKERITIVAFNHPLPCCLDASNNVHVILDASNHAYSSIFQDIKHKLQVKKVSDPMLMINANSRNIEGCSEHSEQGFGYIKLTWDFEQETISKTVPTFLQPYIYH